MNDSLLARFALRNLQHALGAVLLCLVMGEARLPAALASDAKVEPVLSVGQGAKLVNATVQKNAFNASWRVAFVLKPDGGNTSVDLRCYLREGTEAITETWSYLWTP